MGSGSFGQSCDALQKGLRAPVTGGNAVFRTLATPPHSSSHAESTNRVAAGPDWSAPRPSQRANEVLLRERSCRTGSPRCHLGTGTGTTADTEDDVEGVDVIVLAKPANEHGVRLVECARRPAPEVGAEAPLPTSGMRSSSVAVASTRPIWSRVRRRAWRFGPTQPIGHARRGSRSLAKALCRRRRPKL